MHKQRKSFLIAKQLLILSSSVANPNAIINTRNTSGIGVDGTSPIGVSSFSALGIGVSGEGQIGVGERGNDISNNIGSVGDGVVASGGFSQGGTGSIGVRAFGGESGKKGGIGAYAKSGESKNAQALLKRLEADKSVSHASLTSLTMALGVREQAFASLERAYAAHDSQLHFLRISPPPDPLRSGPRFQDLLRRVGLAP